MKYLTDNIKPVNDYRKKRPLTTTFSCPVQGPGFNLTGTLFTPIDSVREVYNRWWLQAGDKVGVALAFSASMDRPIPAASSENDPLFMECFQSDKDAFMMV